MTESGKKSSRRGGGRTARIAQRAAPTDDRANTRTGHTGCQYHALSEPDILRIHEGALKTLENVGMGIIGNIPEGANTMLCLLYTSPSPRDKRQSRMPSSA